MESRSVDELKRELFMLLEKEALKRGDFTLSSGTKSTYYLDGRVVTLSPRGAYLTAAIILEKVRSLRIDAIGGPTLGADPIVGALACLAHLNHVPLSTFIVRKQAKEHGTQRLIEGPSLASGSRVVLVDDVATTGKALVEAKRSLDALGVAAITAIVIVDRDEGARQNLLEVNLPLESIFSIRDFGL